MSAYVSLHGRILERAVTFGVERAVLEHEVLGVAERLFARYMAVDESQSARVPSEELSVQFRVVHRHVVHLPERVLRVYLRVANLYIARVLEDVLRVRHQSVHLHVAAVHERVRTLVQYHVLQLQSVDAPERLVGIVHGYVLQRQILHLAEELRTVYHAVLHVHIVRVPYRRARARSEIAVAYVRSLHVPQRVLALEVAVAADDVAALLYARFAEGDAHVVELHVVYLEERTLSAENLVTDLFHNDCMKFECSRI